MSTTTLQLDLHQDCLDKLSQILDLVLKTAEAASADNNHKVVIQAAREATRITALMFKLTNPKTKTVPAARSGAGVPANKPAAAALAGEPTSSLKSSSCRTSTPSSRPARLLPGTAPTKPYIIILPRIIGNSRTCATHWPPACPCPATATAQKASRAF